MQDTLQAVLPHHETAARTWNLGGKGYDRNSFSISDAIGHATQRLAPRPGEDILDVGTGTGWCARNVAAYGATVTAVDISSELLSAAEMLSAHIRPAIHFRLADAEQLPFPDGRFDRVISTFGVMFAQNQVQAAAELGRVCKRGGRLVLSTWTPESSVGKFFGIVAEHGKSPPPQASPMSWGDPAHVRKLLGNDFELIFERGVNHSYFDTADDAWEMFSNGFGPVKRVINALGEKELAAFRQALKEYHESFMTDNGLIRIEREYLVTLGRRK